MAQRRTGRVPVKVLARSAFWIVVLAAALVAGSPIVWLVVAGGLALGLLALWTTTRGGSRSRARRPTPDPDDPP